MHGTVYGLVHGMVHGCMAWCMGAFVVVVVIESERWTCPTLYKEHKKFNMRNGQAFLLD